MQAAHGPQSNLHFSRTFDRCPVLVGRDGAVANCVLADGRVSRLHASFDIRDDRICVRDSGSTNGTFVNGERLPFDRWVVAGAIDRMCEIRIAEWILKVNVVEIPSTDASQIEDFLTAVPPEPRQPLPLGAKLSDYIDQASLRSALASASGAGSAGSAAVGSGVAPVAAAALPPSFGGATQVVASSTLRIARAWAMLIGARHGLVMSVAEVCDATPLAERPALVREILKACGGIEREPGVRVLLERHGGTSLPHTLESGAALALQELARWYVANQPPLANATEVFAFARKLKSGIDELLLGLVPLFAGLDRFEQQMALRPFEARDPDAPAHSSRLPRVPRDAARRLFNWRDPSDDAVRAVRTDLVDLTMHQVAVLNGVMRGVKQLLDELSPETIDQALGRRLQKRGVLGRFFGSFRAAKDRWTLYRERHGDLADEENERFRVIFGPEFVAEYKQSGEAAQGRPAAPPTPWPPQQRPPDPQNRT